MSPLENHVTQAVGKAQPGAAVDFGIIMQIMSMVLQFIQQCPFGNARRAIRAGALEAKVAAYRAVKSSGFSGNAVDLTNALIEQGRQATDAELDATIASAHALPPAARSAGAVLLACLWLGSAALGGPFPHSGGSQLSGGPFPGSAVGGQRSEFGGRTSADDQISEGTAPTSAPIAIQQSLNPDSRIPNPPAQSLRERIAAYRARGGGAVGVRGMTITTHMLRDHGWSEAQLAGLTSDELFLLHGMQHAGRISPAEFSSASGSVDAKPTTGYPVEVTNGTAVWSVAGTRWSNLGGGRPVDGQVYHGGGRVFVYRDGRMHESGGENSTPAPLHGCANGRCRIR